MSAEEQHDLVGQTLGKKFLVRRVIGAGGMGVVYEVEHVITKKLGALKLLHRSLASQPRAVERFVREASAAARIENPHIVETYDAGELPSGEPYMFMELLHGSALRDVLVARGRLTFSETRKILLQASNGLAAAHAAGIVHRDIKPENLYITSGSPSHVKILDFGISKFAAHSEHRLTTAGAPMGTPYYMSPEQVAGKSDLDERSDVYALGVVLYECVTGSVPFDAPTLPALSVKIFEGRYTPPSDLQREAPPRLDEVVGRAMAVEPSARYQSMSELKAALEGLAGEEVALAATLESAQGLVPTPQRGPASRETAPLAGESALPEAQRSAPSATPDVRSRDASDAPEAKAPGRSRRALLVGVGVAAVAGAALALNAAKGLSSVTPDDAPAPGPSDDRSRSASSSPPSAASAPALAAPPQPSSVSSAPHERADEAGARGAAASSASNQHRQQAPRPQTSAPSRAARDGLTEENPFGERTPSTF
jgi:serine/threonine-protein kinase